jgi:hypothetical protein
VNGRWPAYLHPEASAATARQEMEAAMSGLSVHSYHEPYRLSPPSLGGQWGRNRFPSVLAVNYLMPLRPSVVRGMAPGSLSVRTDITPIMRCALPAEGGGG